jgi:hypothetical protein
MGRLEVQGIVSKDDNLPYVQFRQLDDDGELEIGWQSTPMEAREMSGQILEATMNAIYDAAIISWAREMWPNEEEKIWALLILIREHRSDKWGLPDQPEDWRT